jgi:hypothetical protein
MKKIFFQVKVLLPVVAVLLFGLSGRALGQTTIASEGFETGGTTLFSLTTTGGTTEFSSQYANTGSFGFGYYSTAGLQTATLTSSAINTSGYTDIQMSFRDMSSLVNANDNTDYIQVYVSPDNGITYYLRLWLIGDGNNMWTYSSGTAIASDVYSATNIGGVSHTISASNLYGTMTITGLPDVSELRIRVVIGNGTGGTERWGIDDFIIAGTLSSNTITTGTINGSPFCVGASFGASVSVPFVSTGTFTSNTYSAQLSDASGSFASPTVIGTLPSNANSGTISSSIPENTPSGTGYRIRVVSSSPGVTGSLSSDFQIINGVINVTSPLSGGENASALLSWTNPSGCYEEIMIIARIGSSVTALPSGNGSAYTANLAFGSGTAFDGGYVVYKGTSSPQTVTGLTNGTTYYFTFFTRSESDWSSGISTSAMALSAVAGDYRSSATGNWSSSGTWETYNGSAWVAASTSPAAGANVYIQGGFTVSLDAGTNALSQLFIAPGSTFSATGVNTVSATTIIVDGNYFNGSTGTVTKTTMQINNGGLYRHSNTNASLLTATWNTGSTCEITVAVTPDDSSWDQSFYNFIWNCSSQAANISLNGHIASVSGTFTVAGTGIHNIRPGGSPVYANFSQTGGIYQVISEGGGDTRTVNVSNNCSLTGGLLEINFGNTTTAGTFNVGGNFSISSSSASVIMNNSVSGSSGILNVYGDFSMTDGTIYMTSSTTTTNTATSTINVTGNFTHSGGTITENSLGSGTIVFNGTGTQVYTSGGTLSGTVNFTAGSGSNLPLLQMGTGESPSVISNGSSGTFTLLAGATLGITSPDGITSTASGAYGNIQVTGTRSYNTGANYIYNGSSPQSTGDGLPATIGNLTISNYGGEVTFNSARTITNNFSVSNGSVANLGSFTHSAGTIILGGVSQAGCSYGSSSSSASFKNDIFFSTGGTGIIYSGSCTEGTWLGGTSSSWNTSSNWYGSSVPGSSTNVIITMAAPNQPVISGTTAICNNLTIYPGSSLTIAPMGSATVNTLTNNGTLSLNSNSSGMFSLILNSYAGSTGTVNSQIWMTGGEAGTDMWRWHYFAVPSHQSKNVLTTTYGDDLLRYDDETGMTNINGGWQWHDGYDNTTAFSNLLTGDGYSFYDNENTTVNFNTPAGTAILANLPSKSLTFNTYGWNLIGNSLTCGLDWDDVTFSGNVDHTVFFLKDYLEYYYIQGGPSVPFGTYDGHIPPLQGFFVKANSSGASISFTNAREHNSTPFYKGEPNNGGSKGKLPVIRLSLGKDTLNDEMVVWFHENATIGNDNEFDAEKWTSEGKRPQIYSFDDNKDYVINGIPFPDKSVDIPLAFWAPENGIYKIKQIQLENTEDYAFLLRDLVEKININLRTTPDYTFSASAGTVKNRFVLSIVNLTTGIDDNTVSEKPFNIYSSFGFINIELMSDAWEGKDGSVKVIDLTGRTLIDSRNVEFSKTTIIQLPMAGTRGVFMVELSSSPLRYVGRVAVR